MKGRNAAFRENRKKGIIFLANAINKKGRKPFDVVERVQSKLNEFNLTSRGERKGFTLEKNDEFMRTVVNGHKQHT